MEGWDIPRMIWTSNTRINNNDDDGDGKNNNNKADL